MFYLDYLIKTKLLPTYQPSNDYRFIDGGILYL